MTTVAQYKKHTHREHILELPDTYIGSVDTSLEHRWVWDEATGGMTWRAVQFCPGFHKIFDEVLVNALDHRVRMTGRTGADCMQVKHVDVTLTPTLITVRNDGDGIPVEMHPDTGLWAPELIFGNLLTSSNYDKSEEKIVGGKNGYGGKCCRHDTPVLLWNGTVKPAESIEIGDQLIGDDGTLRNVLSVITGSGQLYRVNQAHGESYVVNDAHTLTMCMPDHKVIFWNTSKNGWSMLWWDNASKSISVKTISVSKPSAIKCEECGEMLASNIQRHYRRLHKDKPIPVKERSSPVITPEDSGEIRKARVEMETFASAIPDNNVFDITIGEYMTLNETTKKRIAGVRGKCVDWKKQDVELDPYVLGLWLGDGFQTGYGYACYGEKDPELIKYLEEWGAKNDATITKVERCSYRITSTSNKCKKGCAPLRSLLAKYNLVNNKHIPHQYLQNDRDTRLKVLAGIIDTDGCVTRDGTRISITQGEVHETLAKQIVYLARSLGFATTVSNRVCKYSYNGEKRTSRSYYINISGENICDIPTLLPRKKCKGTVARSTDMHTGFLTIEDAGVDKYVGIRIDGNERFLINDFTVTHNCTNIFSNEFTIETVDHRQKKKYVQTWTSNMSIVAKPKITSSSVKPYTEIRFMPDLSRFAWGGPTPTEIPADMLAVLATRVIDAAACAGKDCKVSLNGKLVTSNTFPKYIGLYLKDDTGSVMTGESVTGSDGAESVVGSEDGGAAVAVGGAGAPAKKARAPAAPKRVAFEAAGVRWEIGAILTRDLHGDAPPDERHISFVNGIATRRGGKHVEYVSKKILGDFCELAKKKAKIDITPALLKDSMVWFINSTIVNPSFDTQTKETLTTPASKFGSTPEITPKFCDQLIKIGLLNEAQALLDAKISRDAKRTDGRKKSTVRGIPKLDDAEWAGTPKSTECTLILTEGDSAKTLAIAGLAVVGRQKYGVFPLKGKILNVKDISADKKLKNQELTYIKQILGLETGKVYTDVKQLRYGKLMIMTDQDVDGSHIKGLLMNLFHTDWPSLLKLGFLCCLMTPLLKATKGRETHNFYSASEFEEWKASLGDDGARGWKIKYYKGLGTSTAAEGREYFESMNSVDYVWNDDSDSAIDLAFNKKRADDRKEWLATFDRARHLEVKSGGARVDYSRFVHDELIHFSNYDNIRSLPHVMDGLKPSQRKIFWAALKKNLTSEIKVAQLAGYVSEVAAYHHGEASLNGAIINMAQNYVGSNNLNLLVPNGQFGTRLMGGEDSAAPRYIFTELNKMVRAVVKKEDDPILTYTEDDGQMVEPETYMPVVPLLLINGSLGIGTGFSTNVLPYNPADIVAALKLRLSGGTADLSATELTPWWFGFRGSTTRSADGKTFTTKGIYQFLDDDACTVRITELPVGCWTQDYKDFLEEMLVAQEKGGAAGKKDKDGGEKEIALRSYTAAYNDVQVDFTLHLDPDYYHTARSYISEFESKFKLCTTHKTTNMVAFDVDGKIRKFMSTGEILETFYNTRLAGYTQRRLKELERLGADITECNARLVFVRAVVEKLLVIANADDDVLLASMRALELPPLSSGEGLKGYEYLLRMRIDRLKAAAVAELESEHANLMRVRAALEATTAEQLWLSDLDEFSAAWTSYSADRASAYDLSAAAVKPSKARAAGKKPAAPRAPRKPAVVVKNTIVM
jgi:DNA topoisomerase-2